MPIPASFLKHCKWLGGDINKISSFAMWPAIELLGIYPRELKTHPLKKTCTWGIIHPSQTVGAAPRATNWWMVGAMWYSHSVEHSSAIKQWSADTCSIIWEPWKLYSKQKNQHKKQHIFCDSIYMKSPKREIHRDRKHSSRLPGLGEKNGEWLLTVTGVLSKEMKLSGIQ